MGIVVVTGAPGAGKSTLARPLADQLGWSLVEKDVIKEALGDALGEVDGDDQRRLSVASFLVIDALVPQLRDTVIEGNVHPARPSRCASGRCRARSRSSAGARWSGARSASSPEPTATRCTPGVAAARLPRALRRTVGLDHVVEVTTDQAVDVADVVRRVREAMAR